MNNILYVVTARAGSKGLPGKNTKLLAGKPLIQYTFDCIKGVLGTNLQDVCISTDDMNIIRMAQNQGFDVPFVRPEVLSTDTASSRDVLIHAIDYFSSYKQKQYNTVVLLQPTSPFRRPEHISEALAIFFNYESRKMSIDMVVSVRGSKGNPYFNLFEEENGYLTLSKTSSFTRRQDLPKVWEFNGAVYVIDIQSLREISSLSSMQAIVPYEMSVLDSIDIDTSLDFEIANIIFRK